MKKTKKQLYMELLSIEEVTANSELVEFINHEIELLNKKSSSTKSNAKTIANTGIKNEIIKILDSSEDALTITEIVKSLEQDYSNQKISALVKQLTNDGTVIREMEKKVAKFHLA